MLPAAYILFVLVFGDEPVEELPAPFSSHATWVAMALAFILWGGVRFRRSRRRRDFARQHLTEPWRWDHPWHDEVTDTRLSLLSLLGTLPAVVIGTVCLLPFIVGSGAVVVMDERVAMKVIFGAMSLFCAWALYAIWNAESEALHRWLIRLRYGRMRLRLPTLPLALGTRPQVELVVAKELPHLSRVRVTLRRVRGRLERRGSGKKRRTVTLRDIEYQEGQDVRFDALGPGRGLRFELELPSPEPQASTVMGDTAWRHWEVQITAEVPGADLDTTFVVPVYEVPPEATLWRRERASVLTRAG
ncbi:hypothetical protein ACLESD_28115 [Pyxidicoccus sp. 3LFB2]